MDVEVVPVYQHKTTDTGGDRYKYDLSATAPKHYGPGSPAFYAYAAEHPAKTLPNQGSVVRAGELAAGFPTSQDDAKNAGFGNEKRPGDNSWSGGWAFTHDDAYGTVAVYEHGTSNGEKFAYDLAPAATRFGSGWGAGGRPAFYAYADKTPGTVPIYRHSAGGNAPRFMLDQRSDAHDSWSPGELAFYALPTGYRVGDKAANITGLDQNNKPVSLSSLFDGKSWIWVDICAGWCGPCNFMARMAKAFVDNVNHEGLPFKIFSVLSSGANFGPSSQKNAATWAAKYGLTSVVHANAAPDSVIGDLPYRYAFTNGSPEAAFPTSVLIDETQTIRAYHLGCDLDALQNLLANFSARALTGGPWMPW